MLGWLRRGLAATIRTGPKKRVGTDFIEIGGYGMDPVALRSGAVWACVHKIAGRVGGAEFRVGRYDREGRAWRDQPLHAVTRMLMSPSPRLPAYVFWRTLAEQALLTGNGYAVAGQRDSANNPLYLMLADTGGVSLTTNSDSIPIYKGTLSTPGGPQVIWERPFDGVAHVRGPHLNLASGKSASPVHNAAKRSITLHDEAMDAAVETMHNSTRFPAIFKTLIPGTDNPQTKAYMERLNEKMRSVGKGFIPVTPHGIDYQQLQGMQRDMQLAGDLNWVVQDIARVYGVPLALIQHTAGQRPDIEQLEDGLLRDAVWPVLHAMAAALTVCCLTTEQRLSGLAVRAHISAGGPTQSGQAAMAMQMAQTGVATINEVRAMVGLPPREDGDALPTTAGAGDRSEPNNAPAQTPDPNNDPEGDDDDTA